MTAEERFLSCSCFCAAQSMRQPRGSGAATNRATSVRTSVNSTRLHLLGRGTVRRFHRLDLVLRRGEPKLDGILGSGDQRFIAR